MLMWSAPSARPQPPLRSLISRPHNAVVATSMVMLMANRVGADVGVPSIIAFDENVGLPIHCGSPWTAML